MKEKLSKKQRYQKKNEFDQWKFLDQHFNKPKKNWMNKKCNVGAWD